MNFSDRIKAVAGPHPFAWAEDHGFSKSTMQSLLICTIPQRKTLDKLVAATGIPADWWLEGDGPPPLPNKAIQQEIARYNVSKERPTKASAGKAQLLTPNPLWLVLAAGSLNKAEWANEMPIQERMRLVVDLYNLIVFSTGGDEAQMDRIFNRDAAINAALLLLHELELTKDRSSDA